MFSSLMKNYRLYKDHLNVNLNKYNMLNECQPFRGSILLTMSFLSHYTCNPK